MPNIHVRGATTKRHARPRDRRAGRVRAWALLAMLLVASPVAADDTKNAVKEAAPGPSDTTTKTAAIEIATYKDSDHISVFTPSIAAGVENVTRGASVRGSYLVDVVSAASVDIVSTASQRWQEVRHAGSLEAEYKPHTFGVTVAGALSSEPDYFSYNFSALSALDLFEKNTTLTFGFGFGHDTIGRHGTPFSVFARDLSRGSFTGGITQVVNRTTVVGASLDVVIENGDQSKPYRYVPMFAPDVAPTVPNGASIDSVNANRLPERLLEQTPLARRRFAVTARYAHRFETSTLRLQERIYYDSWGLFASTTNARWIFDFGRRLELWPEARFHGQSAVSFWKRAYVSGPAPGWDLPELRTGDRELGPLWTVSGGGGVKLFLGGKADPRAWALSLQVTGLYTGFLDNLYLTQRTGFLGSLMLEAEL